jgi:hypothetical protein
MRITNRGIVYLNYCYEIQVTGSTDLMSIAHVSISKHGSFDVLMGDQNAGSLMLTPRPKVDKSIGNLTDIKFQNAVSLLWTHDIIQHS